jgi:hypothetical protein
VRTNENLPGWAHGVVWVKQPLGIGGLLPWLPANGRESERPEDWRAQLQALASTWKISTQPEKLRFSGETDEKLQARIDREYVLEQRKRRANARGALWQVVYAEALGVQAFDHRDRLEAHYVAVLIDQRVSNPEGRARSVHEEAYEAARELLEHTDGPILGPDDVEGSEDRCTMCGTPATRAYDLHGEWIGYVSRRTSRAAEQAITALLRWTPELTGTRELRAWSKAVNGYPVDDGDGDAPFVSESFLYPLLGKDDARSFRGYLRAAFEAVGVRWDRLPLRDEA